MRKLVLLAVATSIVFSPLAASAHDAVESTSPADQTTVSAGAFDVSVTFGEDILQTAGNAGEVIRVTSASGEIVSNGCPVVSGTVLSTPIDVDAPGEYTVAWRSVSSDGHATEGTFNFTVENTTGYASAGIPAATGDCAAQEAATSTSNTSSDNSGLIGLGIAISLVVIGAVAGALRFGRKADPKQYN